MRKVLTPTWEVWVRAIVHNSTVKNLNSPASLPKSRNRDHFLTHNSFYENHHHTKPKSDKDITRQENHQWISLMSIDSKILSKILGNQSQQYIRRIIPHNSVCVLDIQGEVQNFKVN